MRSLLVLILSALSLVGCGQMVEKNENKQQTASVSLLGEWEGRLYELNDTSVSRAITMALHGEGGFVILGENMRASGRFTEFGDNRSILFEMHESTDVVLGLKGSLQDFNYSLTGDELVLRSEKYVYKLKRTKSADSVMSLDGRWVCFDTATNRWELSIQKSDFWAQVSKSGGSPAVMIRGTMQYVPQDDNNKLQAKVFVQSSQPQTDIGMIVIEKVAVDMKMMLLNKNNEPLQGGKAFSCQAL